MRRSFLCWVACMFSVWAPVFAQESFRLIAPDRSFAITFPGRPRHEVTVSDSGPLHTEIHEYALKRPGGNYYLRRFNFSPPTPSGSDRSRAIDHAISKMVKDAEGELLLHRATTMAGIPARAVRIRATGDIIIDGRVLFADSGLYELLFFHEDEMSPPSMHEFFDSFTLNEP